MSAAAPTGRVEEEPLALWDLLPTFLELAGVARPAGYHDLVRILNAARTDPGGRLSFPPLREECPGGA